MIYIKHPTNHQINKNMILVQPSELSAV